MRTVETAEFTNKLNDDVRISLLADSFGGFHLIIKSVRIRRTTEQRFIKGELTGIPVGTVSEETTHKQLPTEYSALNEFKLECFINNMPNFDSKAYSEWQAANSEKEV